MACCYVSTFPPARCGIGNYTASLARAVAATAGEEVVVLSELGAERSASGPVRSVPSFDRHGDMVGAIAQAARRVESPVVHVQHAPDIFGMDGCVRLVRALRDVGKKTVITLHTVHSPASGALERRFRVRRFHRDLARVVDRIVVHGRAGMRDELVRQGVDEERIAVIPHGTGVVRPPEPLECRRRLGLPERFLEQPLLLYFGFVHLQKNLHTVVKALAALDRPDVNLLVVGSIQNENLSNRAYLWFCRNLVDPRGLTGRVVFREAFVPADDVPLYYGAADLVLLPHAQAYGSASGVVHDAVGAGARVLCSASPKFTEVAEHVDASLRVPTFSAGAWAKRIAELLSADREKSLSRIRAFAEATAWPSVAQRHLELYRRV